MHWICALLIIGLGFGTTVPAISAAPSDQEHPVWKGYTNARFGFSLRYPATWKLGNPLPGGIGITFQPPIDQSLVAFSGHMNLLEGSSQDKRQTLGEFATAHRRIITDLFEKKKVALTWQKEQDTTLAGFPAKRLAFTYQDDQQRPNPNSTRPARWLQQKLNEAAPRREGRTLVRLRKSRCIGGFFPLVSDRCWTAGQLTGWLCDPTINPLEPCI